MLLPFSLHNLFKSLVNRLSIPSLFIKNLFRVNIDRWLKGMLLSQLSLPKCHVGFIIGKSLFQCLHVQPVEWIWLILFIHTLCFEFV